jgi:hypothetical protein
MKLKSIFLVLALLLATPVFMPPAEAIVFFNGIPRNDYTGNGSTTTFAYTFEIDDQIHIQVAVDNVIKTLGTDYTVTGVNSDQGGQIIFNVAPAANSHIAFYRLAPLNQQTSYPAGGAISGPRIERDLDIATMAIQELAESHNRGLRFPPWSPYNGNNLTLDLPSPVANKCIGWNSTATAITLNDCVGSSGTFSGNATSLQGNAISTAAPSNQQVLLWDGPSNTWKPADNAAQKPTFNNILSGTNTTASMQIGAGASLGVTSTGTITATGVVGLTAAKALQSDGSGNLQASGVTATELSLLAGVTTTPVQTQLNAKEATANKNQPSGYAGLDAGSRIAKGQGNSATVYNDQANSYTAGSKQSVQHNATTAGLNVTPGTGDPSTPVNGDVWYNNSTGKFRARENGATTDIITSGGSVAFSAITSGTNTNALVIGTGGSLQASGSGNIAATTAAALAADPTDCSAGQAPTGINAAGVAQGCTNYLEEPAANGIAVKTASNTSINRSIANGTGITVTNGDGVAGNPTVAVDSSIVKNNAANTFTTGAQDYSAATQFFIPRSAGATAATNSQLAYDTTNNMYHAGQSSADAKLPTFTVTPANNDCVTWVVSGNNYKLGTAGAGCGTGSGGSVGPGTTSKIPKFATTTTITDSNMADTGTNITMAVPPVIGDCSTNCLTLDPSLITGTKTITYPNATDTLVAKATADVLTNKTIDAEGTGNVITIPTYVSLATAGCNNATAAAGFDLPTSGAPTPSCFGTTTTQGTLSFADAATQTATNHFRLPTDWTGAVDIDLFWFANAASSNAVRWSVATGCVADSEAISTGPSYNTASASNTAYTGTANQRKTTSFTGVSMTNCSAGETAYLQVQRIGGDAGDTLTATAELLEVGIKIRRAM